MLFRSLRRINCIDSEEAINIFKDANNVLNVSPTDMPNITASNIISQIVKEFPKMMRDCSDDKRINRPYIDKRLLYIELKNMLEGSSITEKKLMINIRKKNLELGLIDRKELKVPEKMYETASNNGFYIGLIKNLKWVNKNLLK